MDHTVCPGARMLRQPKPEIFSCPSCGEEVEIWSDELRGTCPSCGATVLRDGLMSCLDWCLMGKECVGEGVYGKYMQQKAESIRERLLEVVAGYSHEPAGSAAKEQEMHGSAHFAEEALRHAERLAATETCEWHIVLPASILSVWRANRDGEDSIEKKRVQGEARRVLSERGFSLTAIDEIFAIAGLENTANGAESSGNYRVVHDAIVLAESRDPASLLTESARKM